MRHLWQWLCGYICVCIKGRQVNRFLNLCSRNGIHLWRITYDIEHVLRANIRLKDFYELKPYLRKTKTRLNILYKKGFPFWCHKHPKIKWFLCLCLCLTALGLYSLNFIWNIEITGNKQVKTDQIITYLQENNIDIGLKKNRIDCSKIEVLLRDNFHELGWVSVYINNTDLCISVKESLYDIVEHQESAYGYQYNIIANKAARIYSIVTRTGKAVVKNGQSVNPGDILVIGQNEIFDDSGTIKDILYCKADAEIWGDVIYEVEIPLSEIEIMSLKIAENYEDKSLLRLGFRKLQLYQKKLEDNGVIVLNTKINLYKTERNICFRVKIYAREQIGINIPVEEIIGNEFE